MKRLVSLCLCFSLILTFTNFSVGFYSFADSNLKTSAESWITSTPSNAQKATPSEVEDIKDKSPELSTPSEVKKVIVEFEGYDPYGYEPLQTITLDEDKKDTLKLPEIIKVRLNDNTKFIDLPVTWECDDNYGDTEYETYTFNIKLPDKYVLEEQLQANVSAFQASLPWIQVNIWSFNNNARGVSIFDQKISMLRNKFPQGKYWNHVGGSNNPDGYTSTPCPNHNNCGYYPNQCSCNSYSNAIQCLGFALKVGYDVFGSDPRNWDKHYNLDEVSVGDIIQLNPMHTVMVIAIDPNDSNYMALVEANYHIKPTDHCRINWDRVVTKSSLRSNFQYFKHAPNYDQIVNVNQDNPKGALDSPTYKTYYNTINIGGWGMCGNADFDVNIYIDQVDASHAIKYFSKDQLAWRPDLNYQGGFGGFDYDISKLSAGEHKVILRVFNLETGQISLTEQKFIVAKDTEPPKISNVKISDLSYTGYTITCNVTDNIGVDRVQFPTWTDYKGQDDLFSDWQNNKKASGSINGNTVSYRVNIADHKNESGKYITHIFAFDRQKNSSTYKLEVTVPQNIPLSSISLDKTEITIEEGKGQQLKVSYYPSNTTYDKTINWSINDQSVAIVKDGYVTAKASGIAIVSATVSGKTATCKIVVSKRVVKVSEIIISKSTMSLTVGESEKLTASIMPSNAVNKNVKWLSSNSQIASVSDNGIVEAKLKGEATIYAEAQDGSGVKASCLINVISGSGNSGGSSSGGGGGSTSGGGSHSGGGGSSGGGSITGSSGKGPNGGGMASLPDYVVKGNWVQAVDMNWKFTDSNGVLYLNKWAAIENPYANTASGQSAFDWFYFDANGNMATGWHQEGENLFYLNQNSDGTRGRMVTGWFWIPDQNGVQKCYYFNPNSDGTRGKLIRNSVINENIVNANGEWVVNGVVQTK